MQQKIGDTQSKWESAIIRDLDYIKTNKRYRWNAKLRAPLIVYSILFLLVACIVVVGIKDTDTKMFARLFMPFVSLFSFGILLSRYLQSLKFINLQTGLSKDMNHDLLVSFLNQKGLLIYYHPETNDVVQIISRPLGIKDDRREALVFVIDENEILINSYFTESGWKLTAGRRHDKQMGDELMHWITQYKIQNEKTISHSSSI